MLITLTSLLAVTINIVPMAASYSNKTSEIIKDFSGNVFILKEGDNSYEILTEDNMFIEGSYSSNSPYYNKVDGIFRDNPICFEFDILNRTTRIRYEAYKENPNTDSNKGRICIGDTTFIA